MSDKDPSASKSEESAGAAGATLPAIPSKVEVERQGLAAAPTLAPPTQPALQTGQAEVARGTGEPKNRIDRNGTTEPKPVHAGRPGPVELPAVGTTIGHYEIIRELGRGGMGVVFLARDIKLARRVAIKFLLTQHDAQIDRFLAEARATARCRHDNIVVIHDVGDFCKSPYMVLEYLRGTNLRQALDGAPTPPQRAAELMIPIVRALHQAHQHGIVHRDLKPENVFICEDGAVKVLDFGIAKLLSELSHQTVIGLDTSSALSLARGAARGGMTHTGALIGTLPYMSPEQMRCSAVDHRTDIWAVGMMLYEMVLGEHPLAPLQPGTLLALADGEIDVPSARARVYGIGELGAIIDRCLVHRRDQRTSSTRKLLAELTALVPQHGALTAGSDQCPFAGLAAFQEADAKRFYGRGQETASILSRLRAEPMVTVTGASGTGKSSLIRAGVIPALKRLGEGWRALVVRPGRQPLAALVDSLARLGLSSPSPTRNARAAAHPGDFSHCLSQEPGLFGFELRQWADCQQGRIVLFVDQLEELYTQGIGARERLAFVRCLEGAADDASSAVRVIATIRSDFLDRAMLDRSNLTEATRGLMFLPPMTRTGLRRALTAPVEAVGYRFESPDLVEDILDALEETPGALPLLQFAGTKLWDHRDQLVRRLTRASHDAMGGVAGALASHANAVLRSLSPQEQALVREVFLHLVTAERTRALVSMAELRDLWQEPDTIERLVAILVDSRLLVTSSGDDESGALVEIVHESLVHSWPMLSHWLDEKQEDAPFLEQLKAAARQWDARGRPAGLLWRGTAAQEAEAWYRRYRGLLPGLHKDYMDAVIALTARSARRKRLLVAGSMGFLILLVMAAAVALVVIDRAKREARASEDTIRQQYQELAREREAKTQATRRARAFEQKAHEANETVELSREQLKESLEKAQQAEQAARQAEAEAREAKNEAEEANTALTRMLAQKQRLLKEAEKKYQTLRNEMGVEIDDEL